MPGERGTPREGLLAVGIRALVRAFSRMYPTVSSQGTRVAERL
jgi:hypothetical protein